MQENDYRIPTEIKSDTLLGLGIALQDGAIIFTYFIFMLFFENLIYQDLIAVYYIFNILVAITLTRKTRENPQKRKLHKYAFYLLKRNQKRTKYKGLDSDKKELLYMEY